MLQRTEHATQAWACLQICAKTQHDIIESSFSAMAT
jgi:hypothetical protein